LVNTPETEEESEVIVDEKELLTNLAAEFNFMLAGKKLLAGPQTGN
jgi:hypothetical protein